MAQVIFHGNTDLIKGSKLYNLSVKINNGEHLNVLEELGQADTYLYNSETNFQRKIFVKNEKDFDLIKSLPLYKNSVELVKEFPNE